MFGPRAITESDESAVRRLVYLRLIVSTLIVGAMILVLQSEDRFLIVTAMCGTLGVVYLSSAAVFFTSRAGYGLKAVVRMIVAVDTAVVTMLVHLSGGAGSFFSILYILPVIVSGEYSGVRGGVSSATVASSIYLAYILLELSDIVRPVGGVWVVDIGSGGILRALLRGYLNVAVFYFTGIVSGYVSNRLRSKDIDIAVKDREIRQIRLDTASILKNMSSGLIVTDTDGTVLNVNPAAHSILRLDERDGLEGFPVEEVLGSMRVLADELKLALDTGLATQRHEIDIVRADGTAAQLGVSISLLRDENEDIKGVIAIFQDLTEVKEMRERIRQADRMAAVGELSAAIAHEVRAPLASISGSIDMLKGELEGLSGDNSELMDLIIRESERLDRIISDFLEYARMRRPSHTPTDIIRIMKETAILLRNACQSGNDIDICVECGPDVGKIGADDELMRQVFLNLGNNACEAMGAGGRLTMSIDRVVRRLCEDRPEEDCVEIRFHNDGPAIPGDVLPHVFEPFFTTRECGTGLGLAIAARIVESHSGLIDVRSSEEGGTDFVIILPERAGFESRGGIETDEQEEIAEEEHSMV